MLLNQIEDVTPFWSGSCPECNNYMSFTHGASMAICTWGCCRATFDIHYERDDHGELFPFLLCKEPAKHPDLLKVLNG